MNCELRGDHCHHPNTHGFSYFYGLPFTLFNDCRPGEGKDVLADLQNTLWQLTLLGALALLSLVGSNTSLFHMTEYHVCSTYSISECLKQFTGLDDNDSHGFLKVMWVCLTPLSLSVGVCPCVWSA